MCGDPWLERKDQRQVVINWPTFVARASVPNWLRQNRTSPRRPGDLLWLPMRSATQLPRQSRLPR